ncbi:hypothetical protein BDN72DRAFT_864877, partial [Pluteus cervinus]
MSDNPEETVTLHLPLSVCQALLRHFESLEELDEATRRTYCYLRDCVEDISQTMWSSPLRLRRRYNTNGLYNPYAHHDFDTMNYPYSTNLGQPSGSTDLDSITNMLSLEEQQEDTGFVALYTFYIYIPSDTSSISFHLFHIVYFGIPNTYTHNTKVFVKIGMAERERERGKQRKKLGHRHRMATTVVYYNGKRNFGGTSHTIQFPSPVAFDDTNQAFEETESPTSRAPNHDHISPLSSRWLGKQRAFTEPDASTALTPPGGDSFRNIQPPHTPSQPSGDAWSSPMSPLTPEAVVALQLATARNHIEDNAEDGQTRGRTATCGRKKGARRSTKDKKRREVPQAAERDFNQLFPQDGPEEEPQREEEGEGHGGQDLDVDMDVFNLDMEFNIDLGEGEGSGRGQASGSQQQEDHSGGPGAVGHGGGGGGGAGEGGGSSRQEHEGQDVNPRTDDGPVAETGLLSDHAIAMISELASFCQLLNTPTESLTMPAIEAYLTVSSVLCPTAEDLAEESASSLVLLAHRCYMREREHASVFFNYAISVILFRLSIQNTMTKNPKKYPHRSKIFTELSPLVGKSTKMLERYAAEGAKLCLLAGAGPYVKEPLGDPQGDQIIDDIIPAIGKLRKKFSFTIPTMYEDQTQRYYSLPSGPLDCQD